MGDKTRNEREVSSKCMKYNSNKYKSTSVISQDILYTSSALSYILQFDESFHKRDQTFIYFTTNNNNT